jgi:hypothetical protein
VCLPWICTSWKTSFRRRCISLFRVALRCRVGLLASFGRLIQRGCSALARLDGCVRKQGPVRRSVFELSVPESDKLSVQVLGRKRCQTVASEKGVQPGSGKCPEIRTAGSIVNGLKGKDFQQTKKNVLKFEQQVPL